VFNLSFFKNISIATAILSWTTRPDEGITSIRRMTSAMVSKISELIYVFSGKKLIISPSLIAVAHKQ
jgi:hypothetical protein